VTDLVLIYESVTSTSADRWLTPHSSTLRSLTTDLRLTRSSLCGFLYGLSVKDKDKDKGKGKGKGKVIPVLNELSTTP
jgi:hypothetical protein